MDEYRDEVRRIHKEVRWTFWKVLPLVVLSIVILGAIGFGMRSLGLIGDTVVERKVFEQSYQRSESIKAQIATDEAVLTEIERKLANPNLDEDTRHNLEAQAAAARVRIATAKGKQ